jgi:hypothetical protein
MDLSKIFNLEADNYTEIYNITGERLEELGKLITAPLIKSAFNGRNTLEASVDFFRSLRDKNLKPNELLYISFIAGASYVTILENAKTFANAESI